MISRDRLAIVVFGVGSVGAAAWAYVGVRSVLRMLNEGGGFGSAGIFELLKYLLPFFLTLRLSIGIRHWGRLGRIFQRTYLLVLFAIFGAFALLLTESIFHRHIFGNGLIDWSIFVAALVAGAVWLPVQTFFAAAFVALRIRLRTPSAT
jgi:hypothetical protein